MQNNSCHTSNFKKIFIMIIFLLTSVIYFKTAHGDENEKFLDDEDSKSLNELSQKSKLLKNKLQLIKTSIRKFSDYYDSNKKLTEELRNKLKEEPNNLSEEELLYLTKHTDNASQLQDLISKYNEIFHTLEKIDNEEKRMRTNFNEASQNILMATISNALDNLANLQKGLNAINASYQCYASHAKTIGKNGQNLFEKEMDVTDEVFINKCIEYGVLGGSSKTPISELQKNLHKTAKCLSIDPMALLVIFINETHINPHSKNGGPKGIYMGIGQMTSSVYKTINKSSMLSQLSAECRPLITPTYNPDTFSAMMYVGAYYKMNEENVEKNLLSYRSYIESEEDYFKIKRDMSICSHCNPARGSGFFEKYIMRSFMPGSRITYESFKRILRNTPSSACYKYLINVYEEERVPLILKNSNGSQNCQLQ